MKFTPHLSIFCLALLAADGIAQQPFLYGTEIAARLVRVRRTDGFRLETDTYTGARPFGLAVNGRTFLSTTFSPSQLVRLDPFAGTKTVVGNLPALNFRGLETNPVNGVVYIATDFGGGRLYRVNPTNAALTLVGQIANLGGQVAALGINSTGQAYFSSGGFGQPFRLWRINLTNAATTLVANITGMPTQSRIDSLAFDKNNVLHACHRPSGDVYTVNTSTAVATKKFNGNFASISFMITCPNNVASWNNYGAGWPGTSGVPALTSTPPIMGDDVTLNIGNSRGSNTPAATFVGSATATTPTPFGGTLLLGILFSINSPVVPPAGKQLKIRIPNSPSACGASVYYQSVQLDPGASLGIAFSRGLRHRLGS